MVFIALCLVVPGFFTAYFTIVGIVWGLAFAGIALVGLGRGLVEVLKLLVDVLSVFWAALYIIVAWPLKKLERGFEFAFDGFAVGCGHTYAQVCRRPLISALVLWNIVMWSYVAIMRLPLNLDMQNSRSPPELRPPLSALNTHR